ncbi:hypothetical protein VTO42DRAFT_2693 [Malbranchea cinnamomea]
MSNCSMAGRHCWAVHGPRACSTHPTKHSATTWGFILFSLVQQELVSSLGGGAYNTVLRLLGVCKAPLP